MRVCTAVHTLILNLFIKSLFKASEHLFTRFEYIFKPYEYPFAGFE